MELDKDTVCQMKTELYKASVTNLMSVSKQRLKFIRFYIGLFGVFISINSILAYKTSLSDPFHWYIAICFGVVFVFLTYIFKKIDERNCQLLGIAKEAVKCYENEYNKMLYSNCQEEGTSKLCFISNDENQRESQNSITEQISKIFLLGLVCGFFLAVFFLFAVIFVK